MYLGGLTAEVQVFGKDKCTALSSGDIETATDFSTMMYKDHGMGSLAAKIGDTRSGRRQVLHDSKGKINYQVQAALEEARSLAVKTLTYQAALLLKIADYLSDNRELKPAVLREMVIEHAVDFDVDELKEEGDLIWHRARLKERVALLENGARKDAVGAN
jgi:ATP-dependent Zn protease